MHLRSFFAVLPLALLAAQVPAQLPEGFWRPTLFSSQLPQDVLAADPVAGNFTGHIYPDIAFRVGNQVALCTAPAVHSATDPIVPRPSNGLATLTGGGQGGRDALLVATSSGLLRWEMAPPDVQTTSVVDPGDWQSICVGDVDGVGPDDFVGIIGFARDRLRVVRRRYADPGAPGTSLIAEVQELSFSGQSIHQVVLMQWNDSPQLELCVATNQRVWIGNLTQVIRQATIANTGPSHLTRICVGQRQCLAWLVTPVGGARELRVFNRLGQAISHPDLQGDVRNITAGDLDGNTVDDLAITMEQSGVIKVLSGYDNGLVAEYNGPGYDVEDPAQPVVSSPTPVMCGASWLGDLNADGGCDLVGFLRCGIAPRLYGTVWVFRQTLPGMQVRPTLRGFLIQQTAATVSYSPKIETVLSPPPESATHIELLAWQTMPSESTMRLSPIGRYRSCVPVTPPFAVGFTVPWSEATDRSYVGILRWVRIAAGRVVQVWRPTHFSVALGDFQTPVLTSWLLESALQFPIQPDLIYTPEMTTNRYLMRPMVPELIPEILASSSRSDEGGPGNLPPPPPVPPKPPTPPSDPGG